MTRLPAALGLLLAASCSSRAGVPESPTRAGFGFYPKDRMSIRVDYDFSFTERAGGGDNDQTFWKGGMSGDFRLVIVKTDLSMVFARWEPLEFESRLGARTVKFKDSKLEKNREAEDGRLELPTEPCALELHRDGLLLGVKPENGWRFFGALMSHPPSLLSWLGPLSDDELNEGLELKERREVMLVHSTTVPIRTVGKVSRQHRGGWRVDYTIGVDREDERYGWLKTCIETGKGSLDLDEKGRPVQAALDWSAKTPEGTPIAHFRWACTFTR